MHSGIGEQSSHAYDIPHNTLPFSAKSSVKAMAVARSRPGAAVRCTGLPGHRQGSGTAELCAALCPGLGAIQARSVGICTPECQLQRAVQAQAEQAGDRGPCEWLG